jgi:hypothetical protein
MVQIELAAWSPTPTVLARGAVTQEDIVTTEADFTMRHTLERNEENHTRDANEPFNHPNCLATDGRKLGPVSEVEGAIVFIHGPGDTTIEEREGAADGRNVYREIRPIEN